MQKFKLRIEQSFASLGRLIYRRHYVAIVLVLAIVAILVSNLPKLKIDTSIEGFLHESDPTLQAYQKFRDRFGRDEMVVIAVKTGNVFDLKFLDKLKRLHEQLEQNVPYLEDITSLINARYTLGKQDELVVEDLMEHWPKDQQELLQLKQKVLGNPLYQNLIISTDGSFTTIVIKTQNYADDGGDENALAGFDDESVPDAPKSNREYLSVEENTAIIDAVRSITGQYQTDDFSIFVAGSPVIVDTLRNYMLSDMRKFMGLVILTIALVLFLLFHRVSAVVLPLIIVILALVSTFGIMAILGIKVKLPTTILPSFILAVGIGDAVHLLTIFFRRLRDTDDKQESIAYALGHSGLAIVMTSVTTAAGLASFATAEVAPIADLGKMAAIGVMLALLYTIVLLPALLSIVPLKKKLAITYNSRQAMFDNLLARIAVVSTARPWTIIVCSIALVSVSAIGAAKLVFSHNPLEWLPDDADIYQATHLVDKEMRGTVSVEVVFDTGTENGLHNPVFLQKLEQTTAELMQFSKGELFVGKTVTLTDMLKEINKALNENNPRFYQVPDNRQLIAQELLLFENSGSDDLQDLVDNRFQIGRLTLKMPWVEAVTYGRFVYDLEERLNKRFEGLATVSVTGVVGLLSRTLSAAIVSMGRSYLIAFGVITVLMIMLIGKLRMGLISMAPNLTPILVTLGIMGWFDLPLDMFTMLIGSIAIGLAVDDTIHFMHNFSRYYHVTESLEKSILMTLQSTGNAMLITSIVLSLGFFIYMFSVMGHLTNFGFLTGLTILLALVADFFLAPALLVVTLKNKVKSI